jgi:sulfur-oxidizing protein SoxY
MNPHRRLLLRQAMPGAAVSLALAAGLLRPGASWGGSMNNPAGTQGQAIFDMLMALRSAQPTTSDAIRILAPTIAEDGASVYLECLAKLPDVDGFAVFVENNPQPLVAAFWIGPDLVPEIKTRIKVAQTSNIWVVVRSGGQFFKASKQVKVTKGGCGVGLN